MWPISLIPPHAPAPAFPATISPGRGKILSAAALTRRAPSSCWAGAESWASLTSNGLVGLCGVLDAADVVPRLEGAGALGAVVGSGIRWRGRRKRLLIWSWADRKR